MAEPIGALRAELSIGTASFEQGLKRATTHLSQTIKELSKLGRTLNTIGGRMQDAGRAMSTALTLPLAAVGVGAARAAIQFESAFAGVRKTVEATEEEFKSLERGFRDLTKEIPQSAADLAKIGEAGGQLGIAKENLLDFTRVIAGMSEATNITAEQAGNDFARIANITGLPQTQFENLGSAIVALGNDGASTESEITAMSLRLAAAGTLAGLSTPQILGFGASLANVGIEAEAGGSAMSRIIKQMAGAARNGGDELALFAQVAGTTADQFKQHFERDAAGAIQAFLRGLGQLGGQGALGALEALGITEIRTSDAAARLALSHEKMAATVGLSVEEFRKNEALQREVQERYKTTASQLQLLKNAFVSNAISLGTLLLPAIRATANALRELAPAIEAMVARFGELPEWAQITVGVTALAAALSGPLLFALGSVATQTASVIRLLVTLARTQIGTTLLTGITNLNLGFGMLSRSLVVTTAGVHFLETGLRTAVSASGLLTAGAVTLGAVVGVGLGTALERAGRESSQFSDHIVDGVANVGLFEGAISLLPDLLRATWQLVKDLAGAVADVTRWYLEWSGVSEVVRVAVANLKVQWDNLLTVLGPVGDALRKVIGVLADLGNTIGGGLTKAFEALGNAIFKVAPSAEQQAAKTRDLAKASEIAGRNITDWGEAQRIIGEHLKKTTAAARQAAGATKQGADADAEAARQSNERAAALDRAREALERQKEADKAAAAEAKRHAEEIKRLTEQLSGEAAQQEADKLAESLKGVEDGLAGLAARGKLQGIIENVRRLHKEGAQFTGTLKLIFDAFVDVGDAAGHVGPALEISDGSIVEAKRHSEQMALIWAVITGNVAEVRDMMAGLADRAGAVSRASSSFGDNLKESVKGMSGVILGALQGGGDVGRSVGASLGGALGKDVQGAIGGTLSKALGSTIGGALGSFLPGLGSILGSKLGGLLGKPEFKKVMEDVGRDWGVSLSEGLAKTIAEDSKRLGDRVAATLKNLPAIIEEAGGIEAFGIEKATKAARDLFVQVGTGKLSVEEAGEAFDKVFGQLAPHAISKTTGLASQAFLELIDLNERFGTQSQEVQRFLEGQTSTLVNSLNAIAEGAVVTERSATGLGAAVVAAFAQLREQGLSPQEALERLGPSFEDLRARFAELGVSGGAAFDLLGQQAALFADKVAGPLLNGMIGAGDAIVSLHNSGLLTGEMFTALTATIGETFAKLQEEGKAGPAALQAIAPQLQAVWELQQDFGHAVDASTQELLDQAVAAGVVGDAHRDAQDRIAAATERVADVVEALARHMGVDLPEAANRAAAGIESAFAGIRVPPIDLPVRVGGLPDRFPRPDFPSFDGGSGGFRDFGEGTLAVLHGVEAVVRPDQVQDLAGGAGGIGDTNVVLQPGAVVIEGSQLSPRELQDAITDGLIDALRFNTRGARTEVREAALGGPS